MTRWRLQHPTSVLFAGTYIREALRELDEGHPGIARAILLAAVHELAWAPEPAEEPE